MGDKDKFTPTPSYLHQLLLRTKACDSEMNAINEVAKAARDANVQPTCEYNFEQFMAICDRLKARGGQVAFVASMALSSGFFYFVRKDDLKVTVPSDS